MVNKQTKLNKINCIHNSNSSSHSKSILSLGKSQLLTELEVFKTISQPTQLTFQRGPTVKWKKFLFFFKYLKMVNSMLCIFYYNEEKKYIIGWSKILQYSSPNTLLQNRYQHWSFLPWTTPNSYKKSRKWVLSPIHSPVLYSTLKRGRQGWGGMGISFTWNVIRTVPPKLMGNLPVLHL